MCRWLAYSGTPVSISDLLYRPQHSLIDQSLHSKLGAETTNGDGFGVGWYGEGNTAGIYLPESSYGIVQPGQDELHPFEPKAPSKSTAVPA